MAQTYAQEHALPRKHAGKNPRAQSATKQSNKSDKERSSVSHASVLNDTASAAGEAGAVTSWNGVDQGHPPKSATSLKKESEMQASKGTPHGAEHERHDPATESDLQHPEQIHHNDNEKSKMPERDDEARKQAPNDRPGKKSGEGETPVG